MRAPATLRTRGLAHRNARQAATIAASVRMALNEREQPDTTDHTPTSGYATTELAPGRWMPHDHRPIIGFTKERPA